VYRSDDHQPPTSFVFRLLFMVNARFLYSTTKNTKNTKNARCIDLTIISPDQLRVPATVRGECSVMMINHKEVEERRESIRG
jgi:hypothetical protein